MASATALAKQNERYSDSLARIRRRGKEIALARQHTMWAVGSAATLGYVEAKKLIPLPQFGGMDTSATIGVCAYIASEAGWGGPGFQRTMGSIADGMLSITGYQFGRDMGGKAIASGYGDDDDDDDVDM